MTKFSRLGQRLFNVPLALRPEKCEMLVAALLDHIGVAKFTGIDGVSLEASQLKQRAWDDEDAREARANRRLYELRDGIACIPADGTLVHKLGGVDPWSGMIGYDQLDKRLTAAREDRDVRGILFDGDTPGGETAGMFEFAKKIYSGSARFGGKPVFWLANEMTCSAGSILMSACDRCAMPESGVVGSNGCWTMLADFTQKLSADGIAVTLRRAGERKARGHPAEGWDDELLAKIDAWLDDTRQMQANFIALGRGISAQSVLDQEGDWYHGEEALDRGLIDAIASPDEVFELLREEAA